MAHMNPYNITLKNLTKICREEYLAKKFSNSLLLLEEHGDTRDFRKKVSPRLSCYTMAQQGPSLSIVLAFLQETNLLTTTVFGFKGIVRVCRDQLVITQPFNFGLAGHSRPEFSDIRNVAMVD